MPTVPPSARGAVITGWGTALPDKVLTNDDLRASGLDTSDEWIVERTGIKERRIGGSTASLSVEAGRMAMEMAGLEPSQIDALVLSTTTPDRTIPATSATVQYQLGLFCGRVRRQRRLLRASPTPSSSPTASSPWVPIGSSSSARTRCRASPTGTTATPPCSSPTARAPSSSRRWRAAASCSGWDLDADGSAEEFLYADVGGYIKMDGKEVFRRAVRIMVDSAEKSMEAAGVHADDIALVVPHQANARIIKAACDRLGIGDGPGCHRPRPHRQHVVGVDPAGARRRPRQRTA